MEWWGGVVSVWQAAVDNCGRVLAWPHSLSLNTTLLYRIPWRVNTQIVARPISEVLHVTPTHGV